MAVPPRGAEGEIPRALMAVATTADEDDGDGDGDDDGRR